MPPWAGPDEAAHYIKALGTTSADPLGHAAVWREPEVSFSQRAQAYMGVTSRQYRISGPLVPRIPTIPCFATRPTVTASCGNHRPSGPPETISYVGNYQPLYYVLPGLAARLAGSAVGGLRAARVVASFEVLAMVAVSLALLDDARSGMPAFGVLLVLTPMTLSMAATVTSNAFEIGAAILFTSACVRITRYPHPGGRLLAIAAIGGSILAWSRPLGPVWVVAALVLTAFRAGWPSLVALSKERGLRVAALALTATTAASALWNIVTGLDAQSRTSFASVLHQLPIYARLLPKEHIGIFGWIDTTLPSAAYIVGYLLIVVALVAAFAAGRLRERLALVAAVAFYLCSIIVLILVTTPTGFDVQSRYLLPAWALVAAPVGEILRGYGNRHGNRRWVRRAAAVWVIFFALLNTAAVYVNARRYAVGTGHSWLFFLHPAWSPPGGWIPTLMLLGLAGAGLLGAGLLQLVSSSSEGAAVDVG